MKKSVFFSGSIALMMALGIAIPACSSSVDPASGAKTTDEHSGALGLDLTIGGGVVLSTVGYTVSGNGITPITGTIPVDASGATASILIGALPAGSGYTVTLSADDGKGTKCGGSAGFSITAGQTVGVTVPLNCGAATTRGNASVNGTFNSCPTITSLIVAPLQLNVGGNINVSVAATDADANALSYSWTAGAGTFANPTAATTTYKCTVAGTQTLVISVDDGKGCASTLSAAVNCTPGSGAGGAGGAAAGTGGAAAGTGGAAAGTGGAAAGTGGAAAGTGGAAAGTGGAAAGTGGAAAGTGGAAAGTGGAAAGTGGAAAGAGGAAAGAGGAAAGTGGVSGGASGGTGGASGATCTTCTNSKCSDLVTSCANHEPSCDAVLKCVNDTKCAVGSTNEGVNCYCGALDADTCFNSFDASVPQGPCKDAINLAAGTSVPLQVGQVFFDLSTGIGSAMQEVACKVDSCKVECSL